MFFYIPTYINDTNLLTIVIIVVYISKVVTIIAIIVVACQPHDFSHGAVHPAASPNRRHDTVSQFDGWIEIQVF